jgi:hypothetical protein
MQMPTLSKNTGFCVTVMITAIGAFVSILDFIGKDRVLVDERTGHVLMLTGAIFGQVCNVLSSVTGYITERALPDNNEPLLPN